MRWKNDEQEKWSSYQTHLHLYSLYRLLEDMNLTSRLHSHFPSLSAFPSFSSRSHLRVFFFSPPDLLDYLQKSHCSVVLTFRYHFLQSGLAGDRRSINF